MIPLLVPEISSSGFFVTEWRRGLQELRILVVGNRYYDDEIISLNSLQITLNDAKRSIQKPSPTLLGGFGSFAQHCTMWLSVSKMH